MDDSGIDSDTTKRHTTATEENDRVNINICYFNVFLFCYLSLIHHVINHLLPQESIALKCVYKRFFYKKCQVIHVFKWVMAMSTIAADFYSYFKAVKFFSP